jgi:aminotransferase
VKELLARRAQTADQSAIRAVTRRIATLGGINLGQGTCELQPNPIVLEAAMRAIADGHNVYTFYDGILELKEAVVHRCRRYNRLPVKTENVLVTSGATGGLECVCKCFLEAGDEVIFFDPTYQYHVRLVEERGAIPKFLNLNRPDWSFDGAELESSFTAKTKLLVFSNPQNPTGKVFTRDELMAIGSACRAHNVIAVADEVYEYILRPGYEHISMASLPGLFNHTITLSSASKSFFVTGWRVGWLTAPEEVVGVLGLRSDETYICAPAPLQYGVAAGMMMGDEFFAKIRKSFERRRKLLDSALKETGVLTLASQGAYYILADYTPLGIYDDVAAMEMFVDQVGVAAVPGSAFSRKGSKSNLLRFCFAVADDKLGRACNMLRSRR